RPVPTPSSPARRCSAARAGATPSRRCALPRRPRASERTMPWTIRARRAERPAAPQPARVPSGGPPPDPAAERRTCLRALIWDVDGTLAETERDGHRVAFNDAFAAANLPWRWSVERYGELLAISGGYERLLHDIAQRNDAPRAAAEREALARELHRR